MYNLYESSFQTLSAFPPIKTIEDNANFTRTLDELVEDHSDNVPELAKGMFHLLLRICLKRVQVGMLIPGSLSCSTGFSECQPYLSEEEISNFFDRAVRNRIGIRLIAEQHLAYSFLTARRGRTSGGRNVKDSTQIGVVDTRCTPAKIVRACGYHVETLCEGAYGIGEHFAFLDVVRASADR